jgi:hypothetical protein
MATKPRIGQRVRRVGGYDNTPGTVEARTTDGRLVVRWSDTNLTIERREALERIDPARSFLLAPGALHDI